MTPGSRTAGAQWTGFAVGLLLVATLSGCAESFPPPHVAAGAADGASASTTGAGHELADVPVKVTTSGTLTADQAETPETPELLSPSVSAAKAEESGDAAPAVARPRFRLPDDRPPLNRDELLAEGLRVIESEHLVLVTDLPPESVADLPLLADALFATLEQRLGRLAPDAAGTRFQVTGFLMDARDRFDRAGVLPPENYEIRHGRHLGYRFWMNNQSAEYYRRHLMLHEFVHCFLMCEYGMLDIPPLWYTEGIAEYYATHLLHTKVAGSEFGILPSSDEGFEGWHRITEIRRHFHQEPSATGELADIVPLQTILHPPDTRFQDDSQYAYAWAFVWLINHHPELQSEFAAMAACRTREQFQEALARIPEATWHQLDQIWPLFLDGLEEARIATVRFPVLGTLGPQGLQSDISLPQEFVLDSGVQWVSTGLLLTAGQEIVIRCRGEYVVEETTKAWKSGPDGITIDYVRGRPLGEVIGAIISVDGTHTTRHIPVGATKDLRSPVDGILWLQVNDHWSERERNLGTVTVQISSGNP